MFYLPLDREIPHLLPSLQFSHLFFLTLHTALHLRLFWTGLLLPDYLFYWGLVHHFFLFTWLVWTFFLRNFLCPAFLSRLFLAVWKHNNRHRLFLKWTKPLLQYPFGFLVYYWELSWFGHTHKMRVTRITGRHHRFIVGEIGGWLRRVHHGVLRIAVGGRGEMWWRHWLGRGLIFGEIGGEVGWKLRRVIGIIVGVHWRGKRWSLVWHGVLIKYYYKH